MVVCRLRRNCEFHLHENSSKKSSGSKSPSNGDSSTSALAEEGLQHKGVFKEGMAADGSYKDCISSDNSQSVEHIDSECESDHKSASEVFKDGSSIPQKVYLCFALKLFPRFWLAKF